MKIREWVDDDGMVPYLEDIEEATGSTPRILNRIRNGPEVLEKGKYILKALRYLFEERQQPKLVPISVLLDYTKIFPVHDIERFVTIFRDVDKAVCDFHSSEGD